MADGHKDDLDRVSSQNTFTDLARGTSEHPHRGGFLGDFIDGAIRGAAQGTPYKEAMVRRTEFDDYDLNAMLDLVDKTNPEDLESSGRALWDARDAIKVAADELKGQFETVPWVGKAGDDFRTWGTGLVSSTYDLSSFAGGAGDQITAAAVGLASVRKAMPARDTQSSRKRPEHFTEAEKAANKEDYTAAVKVEKDRQEAINQMNRLASYYAVSKEQLQVLDSKAPTFKDVPEMGVPRPATYAHDPGAASGRSVADDSAGASSGSVGTHHTTIAPTSHGSVHDTGGSTPAPTHQVPGHVPPRVDEPVGTHIDSTGTLPPPTTTAPGPTHTPPVTGTPPTSGGQPNVFPGPVGTPLPGGRTTGRPLNGTGGYRTPPSAQGRAGTSNLGNPGSGRATGQGPANQMGRATSTGQSTARGATSGSKSTPMGRGISGGTPRAGGTGASRTGGGPSTGAGRSNGVVGGRPTNTGGASSKSGARIPRGTVVGGEQAANSRSVNGRVGQRGVFGASEAAGRPASNTTGSHGRTGTSESVTGRPTGRNSSAGAERNGMTRGGSGLVRGPGRDGKPREEKDAEGTARPDYLVEDEETHLPNKPRRDVPPVVD
ncbi:hypothetical protein N8I86_27615 [Streptomyces albidocamelliae]|uniref:Uncharacterized protein n=2 Tax=Streptomyces albidocamelliae TaxID=2981135 RepID=A0ABY6EUW0_9ACTN|nr:hypothetical protein N8I86_27615 [Streptomyces sp. HUAS 14-6]